MLKVSCIGKIRNRMNPNLKVQKEVRGLFICFGFLKAWDTQISFLVRKLLDDYVMD